MQGFYVGRFEKKSVILTKTNLVLCIKENFKDDKSNLLNLPSQ